MVNGCLVYGVPINDEELDKIVEHTEKSMNKDLTEIKKGISEAHSGNFHIAEVFDDLNTLLSGVLLFQNGECCQIDNKNPYFLGWKSIGSSDSKVGSFPVGIPTSNFLKETDYQIRKYVIKTPNFWIMSDECSFCT